MAPGVDPPSFSPAEELAHGVSHGIGIVLAVAGFALLVSSAALRGDAWHVVSAAVYGTTLVLLYTASTLYHAVSRPRAKRVLRILDHAAIYLLIAGTYTPFALISLRGPWGWGLFALVWGGAAGGIVFKAVATGRARIFSIVLYLALGWAVVLAARPLAAAVAAGGIALLAAGGICYTAGLVFFGWKRLRFHHFLWHLCVLAGSVFHYFAILFYVIPRSG